MPSAVTEVRTGSVEDVRKRGMPTVTRTMVNGVPIVDLSGEDHAVPVCCGQGVFHLLKCLEVFGRCQSNLRAMCIGVAPGNVVSVIELRYSRVVALTGHDNIRVITFHADNIGIDVPMDTILAK